MDGYVAIDDVFIDTDKRCRALGSCSFESSLCSWRQAMNNSFNMMRISAQHLKSLLSGLPNLPPTGCEPIAFDATTRTKFGHFMWTNNALFSPNNMSGERTKIT